MKYDMISVGDPTIDTFLFINEAQINCTLVKDTCQICFNYADKLPVENLERSVAGNAANNAVGMKRLGMNTAYVATLGDDGSGEWIYKKLNSEGVDTRFVRLDKNLRTNASTVISYKSERTIFVYHAPRSYSLPAQLSASAWMYYTSVGKNHSRLNKDVVAYVRRTGARLGYNPGTFQFMAGVKAMLPVLEVVNALFVNKEEAMRIVGAQDDVKHYLLALHKLGPKICVLTDAQNGSFVYDGHRFYMMGIPKTKVVERTGAGDAYASGFIGALFHKRPIQEALCWGTMNASSVIMKVGAQAGLLTRSQVARFHKSVKHVCPIEF